MGLIEIQVVDDLNCELLFWGEFSIDVLQKFRATQRKRKFERGIDYPKRTPGQILSSWAW